MEHDMEHEPGQAVFATSRACYTTIYFSNEILQDAAFNPEEFALSKLDRWSKEHGAIKRDERAKPKFAQVTPVTEEQIAYERDYGMKTFRIVARYFFPM